MVNEWLLQINNDTLVGHLALDLGKAFDVLPHDILIEKLALYGCAKLTLLRFHSYLTYRTQQVIVTNISSDICNNKHGVPQGSISGSLMFILFINDLSLHVKYCQIYKYADGTHLCAFGDTTLDLQNIII